MGFRALGVEGFWCFRVLGCGVSGLLEFEGFTVEARKLEHHNHHNLKVQYTESPAPIILNRCSNFLGFTVDA